MFGSLCVDVGDRRLGARQLGGRKPKALLEMLLLARGRSVSRERLAEGLWPHHLPQNVSATLETYVSLLRGRLGRDRDHGRRLIVSQQSAYRIDLDCIEQDLDRFDALVAQASGATRDERMRLHAAALALAVGPLLEDAHDAPWVLAERARYQSLVDRVRVRSAEDALVTGDPDTARDHAEAVLAVDPLNEDACRLSMLGSYALRRPEESVQTFRRCQAELAGALDIKPSADTLRLLNAIQRDVPIHQLLPPAEGDAAHAGRGRVAERRQRDRQLPFLGRTELLQRLDDHLVASRSAFRLVLIEGARWMGRTTVLDRFAAGSIGPFGHTRCSPLHADVPLSTLTAVLRDADRHAGRRGPSIVVEHDTVEQLATGRALHALESLYTQVRSRAPVVLLIDDLHHADVASLMIINHLARRDPAMPVGIVATTLPRRGAEAAAIDALQPAERLHLGPLTPSDVCGAGSIEPDLISYFGGNPRLLADWWRWRAAGNDGIPPSLRARVFSTVRAIGGFAMVVLQVAALLDEPFDLLDVIRCAELPSREAVNELDRLRELGILGVDGAGYRFRHPVVRDVLADTVSPARRELVIARRRHNSTVGDVY
jgi:DNA-binding SARP family transcriptional activator